MQNLKFEWDSASSNATKHQVTFEEAQTVFLDTDALLIPDPEHSASEQRLIIMGLSFENRALVVVHCFRKEKSVIVLSQHEKQEPKNKNHIGRINYENRT